MHFASNVSLRWIRQRVGVRERLMGARCSGLRLCQSELVSLSMLARASTVAQFRCVLMTPRDLSIHPLVSLVRATPLGR